MKVRIGEQTYDMTGIDDAHLSDLIALKRETGLGVIAIQEGLQGLGTGAIDDDALVALGCLVWLTRRRAGERLTLEQACDFPLDHLELIADADDAPPEAPDPTRSAPADTAAAEADEDVAAPV